MAKCVYLFIHFGNCKQTADIFELRAENWNKYATPVTLLMVPTCNSNSNNHL